MLVKAMSHHRSVITNHCSLSLHPLLVGVCRVSSDPLDSNVFVFSQISPIILLRRPPFPITRLLDVNGEIGFQLCELAF